MKGKHRVLWIEEGARFDFPHLAAPVYMDGGYDLVVAENVTTGISYMLESEFHAIIVDIRLPPGDGPEWEELYRRAGYDNVAARLGLKLLHTILGSSEAEVELEEGRLSWVTADRIGVLTVESHAELKDDLEKLGIQAFQQKHADVPETVLLDLVERVIEKHS